MIEEEIDGQKFSIRDDLTLGELSKIQDDSMDFDAKTGVPSFKGASIRTKLIACCVTGMTEEKAGKLPAGVGLKLYAAVQRVNKIPLLG